MAFITLNDNTIIHYTKSGHGSQNVLFVHGNLANTLWWEFAMNELPDKYTAYAIDMPGSGKSKETGKRHTIDYFVSILDNFANTLKLKNFYLVGHSMGGGISQLYTIKHPDKVLKLVCVDSMGADGFHVMFNRGLDVVERMMKDKVLLTKAMNVIMPFCKDDMLRNKLIDAAYAASEQVFMEQPVTMHEANWFNKLSEINCPTLFLHGDHDDFAPKEQAERTAKAIKNSIFKYLKDCGHCPIVEVPEVFNKELFSFLNNK